MAARLTSAFFVAHLTRRLFSDGGFASVLRRGAEEAGAIYVVARGRDGAVRLFEPAVQTVAADDGERRFMATADVTEMDLIERWESEARFDPDFWVVEIETDAPETYLATASEPD